MSTIKYNFYATLLDGFSNYLNSDKIYEQYWGFSENPKLTAEEFEEEQFNSFIDRINRVPFESEPADKGTAYNEVIDCLIENRQPDERFEFESVALKRIIIAKFKNYKWSFDLPLSLRIMKYLKGAQTQVLTEGYLDTKYGIVKLYGYIDHLLPFKAVDLKTTGKYTSFKFKDNWQKIVYPYCLNQEGNEITDFEFVVTDFKNMYLEQYNYVAERDIPELREHVEKLIEFIEINKELITDKKVFNEHTEV